MGVGSEDIDLLENGIELASLKAVLEARALDLADLRFRHGFPGNRKQVSWIDTHFANYGGTDVAKEVGALAVAGKRGMEKDGEVVGVGARGPNGTGSRKRRLNSSDFFHDGFDFVAIIVC